MSERGNWQSWLLFFLRGVAGQARDAIDRAKQLQDLQHHWQERLSQAQAPARLLQMADLVFETLVITIPQAAERLDVSYKTAQRYVERMQKEGMLVQLGDFTYGRMFYAPDILQVVAAPIHSTEALLITQS